MALQTSMSRLDLSVRCEDKEGYAPVSELGEPLHFVTPLLFPADTLRKSDEAKKDNVQPLIVDGKLNFPVRKPRSDSATSTGTKD